MRTVSDDKDHSDPAQARSDLIDLLSHSPENAEAIVTIIQNELTDLKDAEAITKISNTLSAAAASSKIGPGAKDNVLYWLTETTPDVRQMILVQTIEELLGMPQCKEATVEALTRISSEDNVKMVMEWVDRKILTLNQAVYVLLYPDSSTALQ
jgi:hypothetical protein